MTSTQKFIAEKLLQGYYIAPAGAWYRLRSPDHIVVRKFSNKTFLVFNPLLRKNKNVWLLNKNLVRQLHGNEWIKRQYKISLA